MFEIFKFKSKTSEDIPKEIPTNTSDQLEVVVDDSDLDLGDLESGPSGPKRPKLKASYEFSIHLLPRGSKNGKQSKLDTHASTKTHLTCIAKWSGHNNIIVKQTGTVHTQLTTQHQLEIAANREYMNCLIDITLYLAAQGLAFRRHDENKTSLNQEEVGTGTFSIMCDEARCYKDEQMSLCIRYVKDLDIQERFLGFIDCSEKQDAQSLIYHNITVVDIGQIFTNSEDQNIDESFCLPPHMRCCAHTLNLISTTDIKKIKDASYINISESTFIKLFSFWTLISRSTVASDKILEKCGCKFPTPVVTRWNSLYDSSLKVLKYKQQLTKAFDDLHLIKLKLSEWTFLEEYCQVMEPLAISLDKLQGENNSFLGYVAPTILVLRHLLISFTDLKYCKPLSFAIIQAIETRFNYILDLSRPGSKDFIIASMSHPKFKLSWVPLRYMKLCKNLFISECCLRINTETKLTNLTIAQSDKDDSDDDFFDSICNDNDFTSPSESESRNSNLANLQALSFLNLKKKDLDILNDFPVIKEVFLKYNTTIPSSAAVERLFSKAVQVLTTRRNRLSDDTFQMLLCCRSKYDI
ncbi:hypothetical protein QTP88_019152 [Uroleucon formosanum]